MSTPLTSAQSLAVNRGKSSTTDMSSALSDLVNAQAGATSPDRQAFAKWMNQYQDTQAARSAQPSAQRAVNEAVRANKAAAAQPARPTAGGTQTAQSTAHKAQETASERPKAPASKANAPAKPQTPAKARSAEGDKGADEGRQVASDEAEEVTFTTAQGEASAWVKELQPPADMPASDPAAMLAWLATLTQQGGTPEGVLAEGGEAGDGANAALPPDPARATGAGGKGGGPAMLPTDTSALAAQAMASQTKADPGVTEGLAVDAAAAGAQDGPLEFNALMARELWRPAGASASPAESVRHHTGTLSAPVDSPDFSKALAERVGMWVSGPASGGPMTAERRLNPAEMGPVHIRIVLDGQSAQVDFAAAHADTREAIEASLPVLSSTLEEAGLSLSGGGVSDQGGRQAWSQQAAEQQALPWMARSGLNADESTSAAAASLPGAAAPGRSPGRAGGLDLYA